MKPIRVKRSSRAGISLIEVIVAIAIIAVAFFAIATAQITGLFSTARARDIAEAKEVATRTFQDIRSDLVLDVLSDAAPADRWDDFSVDCDVVTTVPETPSGECQGGGSDGIIEFTWALGPAGTEPMVLDEGTADERTATIYTEGAVVVLMKLEWSRGSKSYDLGFMDFISCLDIDPAFCPVPVGR